ncbi:Dihydrodipicolinate synthase [Coemansia sp. Benny D115]|nr:Dihydrodipicolinate synthase [Coemansia sp. Benny D115]
MSDSAAVSGDTSSPLRFIAPLLNTLQNPPVVVFLGVFVFFVVRSALAARSPGPPAFSMKNVTAKAVRAQQDFTPKQLAEFDGRDANTDLLIAVKGIVYDVSPGRGFYGPGGPYASFAGRDASRGLALSDFSPEVLADIEGPVDTLQGLDKAEMDCLDEWATFFAGKYVPVGRLVENDAVGAENAQKAGLEKKES